MGYILFNLVVIYLAVNFCECFSFIELIIKCNNIYILSLGRFLTSMHISGVLIMSEVSNVDSKGKLFYGQEPPSGE